MRVGVLGVWLVSGWAATALAAPPFDEAASSPTRLAFELELEGRPVRVVLHRVAPPVSGDYRVLHLASDGSLGATQVPALECLYRGEIYETNTDAPIDGFASVTTCIHTAGAPAGTTMHGVIGVFDRIWSITPTAPAFDDTTGIRRHDLVPMEILRDGLAIPQGVSIPVTRALLPALPSAPFKEGTPQETKYIEAFAVNDVARVAEQGGEAVAISDTIATVATMNAVIANSGLSPRIRIVLSNQLVFDEDPFTPQPLENGEIDEEDLLNAFNDWAADEPLPAHDLHVLLSGYDFSGNVVGIAPVSGMCSNERSGLVVQATRNLQNLIGLVSIHEIGHSLSMNHDGDNGCPQSGFIMSPSADPRLMNPQFSDCSQGEYLAFIDSANSQCLDDLPPAVAADICGDGVVSGSETCDCGSDDCVELDPCCNGLTCTLVAGATCSVYSDACCVECRMATREDEIVCRPAKSNCDLSETCNGLGLECPGDTYGPSGTTCEDPSGNQGTCFAGGCISRQTECEDLSDAFGIDLSGPSEQCVSQNPCGPVRCEVIDGADCIILNGTEVSDGATCGDAQQCQLGACIPSSSIDECPNDPMKTSPGICGCDAPEIDADTDGTPNCADACPDDAAKVDAGICGCGVPELNSDGDDVLDCMDLCPNDGAKIDPGVCGCGVADADANRDGLVDCLDPCFDEPVETCDANDGGNDDAAIDPEETSGADTRSGEGESDGLNEDLDVTTASCSCQTGSPFGAWALLFAPIVLRPRPRRRKTALL